MAAQGTLVIRFIGDLREFERSTKSLAGKLNKTGRSLTQNLTLPLAAVGASMFKTAADFEAGMNRVAAVSGATGEEFDTLRELAKEMGSTTQFSATQAADAMGFLAMAGFETNDIVSALPPTLQLAAAGQLELAEAADIASNILTGFGMEASQLAEVNDVLAKTFTSTNTDLVMLGEAFKMVGPVAKSTGLSFEETSAAIGLLGNAGIQATMAGTSLRGAITRLINPTKQQAKLIEELGLNVTDAQGNMVPLVDIIAQLEQSGAGTAEVMGLFGQRAGPAMAALIDQGSGALRDLTGELENSGGTAQRIADKQMEGLAGTLKELRSAWEGLMIAFADSGALDFATGVIKGLAGALRGLSEMSPGMMRLILVLGLVAAAVGPILIITAQLITATSTIVGAVTAAKVAWAASGTAAKKGMLAHTFAGLRVVASWIRMGAVATARGAMMAAAWLVTAGPKAATAVAGTVAAAARIIARWVAMAAVSLVQGARIAGAWLLTAGAKAATAVAQTVAAAGRIIAQWVLMATRSAARAAVVAGSWLLLAGANAATAVAATAAAAAKVVAQWIRMGAVAMARAAMMAAAWLVALGPVGWAIAAVAAVAAAVILNWDKVSAWTKKAWTAVTNFLSQAWDWITSKTAGAGRAVVNFVRNAWQSAKDWTVRKATEMVNWVRGLPGRILSALGNLGSLLVNAGRSIVQGLWNGIRAMGSWLKSKIIGFIKSFVPGPVLRFLGISSPSKLFAGIGKEIPAGLAQGILSGVGEVTAAALKMSTATLPDVVRMGTVSDEMWERLKRAGWRGDPTDRMEALYRPADQPAGLDPDVIAAAVEAAVSRALGAVLPVNINVDGKKLASSVEQGLMELAVRR